MAEFQVSTLNMQELSDFADTGEASADIQALLETINVDEASAIAVLNREIDITKRVSTRSGRNIL